MILHDGRIGLVLVGVVLRGALPTVVNALGGRRQVPALLVTPSGSTMCLATPWRRAAA